MVLGALLGLLPIPIPGIGTVTLGIGGGPLIVALIVGRLRRTGPIRWIMPLPANIARRNFHRKGQRERSTRGRGSRYPQCSDRRYWFAVPGGAAAPATLRQPVYFGVESLDLRIGPMVPAQDRI
jgi:hypothetical protein